MAGTKYSRRQFIKLSSLGVAGGVVSPWGITDGFAHKSGRGYMMSGGVQVIDSLPQGLFVDPVEIDSISTPGLVEVELESKVSTVSIMGRRANLLTYNGFFPSPTIRVKKGDLLRIYLKNSLPLPDSWNPLGFEQSNTNLHTHGWHVSPSDNSDNIFLHLEQGENFLFEYDASKQESGTLSWYHPHVHGLVAEQLWGGLAGALVVEDETDVLSEYETHIMVLKDISLSGDGPEPYDRSDYQNGKEGDIIMINGQVNPVLPIKPGQVQRWRIVNASTARYYKLRLENHTLHLIGTDGNLLDKPYSLNEILLTPGERIDVLVQADQFSGAYKFLSLPYSRGGNRLQTVTLMNMVYRGEFIPDSLPSSVNPNATKLDIDLDSLPKRRLTLQMRMGRGLINGKDFEVDPYIITSGTGTFELWEIVNKSMMDHPFHQHTNPSQIVKITGGDTNYAELYSSIPGWKDTINVPRMGGRVLMLVPVLDFAGSAVFHCHIVEHEDIGMMGIWEIS